VLVVPRRLDPKNGVDILVRALPLLRKSHPQLRVLLVGDGEQRPLLESLATSLGVREHLVFCGSQPRQLMPLHLQLADLALLPSRAEAVSLAGLEAMACGLPVVGSRVGGIPEFVIDGQTGALFTVEAHEELAARVLELLALAPADRAALGGRARNFVDARFSWREAAAATSAYYSLACDEFRAGLYRS
jgi:glycosyltransferase involved in cell wall biosynthesis